MKTDVRKARGRRRGKGDQPAVPAEVQLWCDLHSLGVTVLWMDDDNTEVLNGGWFFKIYKLSNPNLSCTAYWWRTLKEIQERAQRVLL